MTLTKETDLPLTPRLVSTQQIRDGRGLISVMQGVALPFKVSRIYVISQWSLQGIRGQHAHKHSWQLLLAINGHLVVALDDGLSWRREFTLVGPESALIIPPGYWRQLAHQHGDLILLAASSREYDESDYIRDYGEFAKWKAKIRTTWSKT